MKLIPFLRCEAAHLFSGAIQGKSTHTVVWSESLLTSHSERLFFFVRIVGLKIFQLAHSSFVRLNLLCMTNTLLVNNRSTGCLSVLRRLQRDDVTLLSLSSMRQKCTRPHITWVYSRFTGLLLWCDSGKTIWTFLLPTVSMQIVKKRNMKRGLVCKIFALSGSVAAKLVKFRDTSERAQGSGCWESESRWCLSDGATPAAMSEAAHSDWSKRFDKIQYVDHIGATEEKSDTVVAVLRGLCWQDVNCNQWHLESPSQRQ